MISDTGRGDWLVARAGAWATAGGVAGAGFDAYARVLHPIEVDRIAAVPDADFGTPARREEALWPWSTVAERVGKTMHPLVQWERLIAAATEKTFPDGWRVSQSRTGWFDPLLLAELTGHLKSATRTPDDVIAGVWCGWGLPGHSGFGVFIAVASGGTEEDIRAEAQAAETRAKREAEDAVAPEFARAVSGGPVMEYPGREYVLLQTSLVELGDPSWGYDAGIGWTPGDARPTPQMLWPEDHSWTVATEIDWDSTIVAGSRSLIDALLCDARFEAFEVNAADDLSLTGDGMN